MNITSEVRSTALTSPRNLEVFDLKHVDHEEQHQDSVANGNAASNHDQCPAKDVGEQAPRCGAERGA